MYDLEYTPLALPELIRDLFLNPFEWAFFAVLFLVAFFTYRSHRFLAWCFFLSAIAWAWISRSLYLYLENIGTDSFFEAQDFYLVEAIAYLHLLFDYIAYNQDNIITIEIRLFLLLFFSLLFALLLHFLIKKSRFLSSVRRVIITGTCTALLAVAFLPIGLNLYPNWAEALQSHTRAAKLFDVGEDIFSEPLDVEKRALHLITYIGESTTSLNMGLYGYWRETTPDLNELASDSDNVLRVDHVFSTHTHTTPSLLEALSVPNFHVQEHSEPTSIFNQSRISIVDILNRAGVHTELLSNQGLAGSWNRAAAVIFRNANHIELSAKELKYPGNFSGDFSIPFDHEFFGKYPGLKNRGEETEHTSVATFMHSYAGHADYLRFIPIDFRTPVDDELSGLSEEAVFGSAAGFFYRLEDYDSAIRYVDYSLSLRIKDVLASKYPTILIYFPDHGESSFTARGHDSSRFLFSMIAIPLIIVVNETAKTEHPDLYESLSSYARSGHTKTLRDIPKLMGRIFGITDILKDERAFQFEEIASPVLVRQLSNRVTGVSLEFNQISQPRYRGIDDARDDATRNFSSARKFADKNVCYHRSNTIARAVTGALASGCIEFDIVVDGDEIHITHPPAPLTGLGLARLSQVVKGYDTAAWIDAKNIDTAKNCNKLQSVLAGIRSRFSDVLVEFPSHSTFKNGALSECVSAFHEIDVQTSYYLPTNQTILCASSIAVADDVIPACRELEAAVNMALASKIQGLSLDYRGAGALDVIKLPDDGITFHTWGLDMEESYDDLERFKFLIPPNDDPNSW